MSRKHCRTRFGTSRTSVKKASCSTREPVDSDCRSEVVRGSDGEDARQHPDEAVGCTVEGNKRSACPHPSVTAAVESMG